MRNTGVRIKEDEKYIDFICKQEGFILATFDPNSYDFIYKLKEIKGIQNISYMTGMDGINITLEKNLELVGVRRKVGKIGEYEILVKKI
ncbi:MAG: hypothetical protein NVS9B7_29230 [Flavisolibacter sp.]